MTFDLDAVRALERIADAAEKSAKVLAAIEERLEKLEEIDFELHKIRGEIIDLTAVVDRKG